MQMVFNNNKILLQQMTSLLPRPGKTGLDWFFYCYFIEQFKHKPVLEVGVGNGGSLISMVAIADQVTAIDSWNQGWHADPVIRHLRHIKPVRLISGNFHHIDHSELGQFGFIHLDANKGYDDVIKDLDIACMLCQGIICVDDYMNSMWPEVTWAIDNFVQHHPQWRKTFITNHQIFLSSQDVDMKTIVADFPVVINGDILYLTYGTLPQYVQQFELSGKMTYSWHKLAWNNHTKQDL